MAGLITYIKESFEELKNNVSWTPWPEAQRLTVIVAVFSIIFSLIIWGIDMYFSDVVTGNLFDTSIYQKYIGYGFWGIVRLVWYVALTGAIFFGISSFFDKKKQ